MKIGILSDTHNNIQNLNVALERLRQNNVQTLIHCGDLTDADLIPALEGFQVILTLGNGDFASGEIRASLLAQNPDNYAGMVYTGRIGEARVAVTHGHLPGKVEELVHSGQYDYVFRGHSHQHRDETIGFTRLINPGALGGLHREPRQFCLLDLETGWAEFIKIND